MLEALNAGSIDLGWTGAPPPIFAQAGGVELVYVGAEPEAPHIEAVIVKPGSSIRTVADLKGKRIAFQKGSSSHFLLVAVLEHAGLRITDVQPVFLPPADARAAFETDRVDAWTVWDPYLAAAQDVLQARVIADYTEVLHPSTFYESSRRFALAQPDILGAVLAELARTGAWANGHRRELAELLAPAVGLPVAVVEKWQARNPYGVRPVDDRIAATQQKVADTFFEQKIIPRRIAVQDYVWTWKPQA